MYCSTDEITASIIAMNTPFTYESDKANVSEQLKFETINIYVKIVQGSESFKIL